MVNPKVVLLASATTTGYASASSARSVLSPSPMPPSAFIADGHPSRRQPSGCDQVISSPPALSALAQEILHSVPRGGESSSNADSHSGSANTANSTSTHTNSKTSTSSSKKKKKKHRDRQGHPRTARQKQQRAKPTANASSSASASTSTPASEAQSKPSAPKSKSSPPPQPAPTPENAVVQEVLRANDYYAILGVPKSATANDIKKAYRKRCVHTHTDKPGGDRKAFDKVTEAYDVLSDEAKRPLYDRYGKQGVDPTNPAGAAGMGGSYQDIFQQMFRQQQQQQQQPRRNPTMRYQMDVTLEDLYFGKTQRLSVQMPTSPNPRSAPSSKNVEVTIPKGSVNGERIKLSGEVDFSDDSHPGDLIFILSERPHPTFTRKEHDLAIKVTISLEEAINGMQKTIRHIDGTFLTLASAPVVITNGDVHVLPGYGMPKRNNVHEHGDLYVQYRVTLPKITDQTASRLTEDERQELGRLLSKLEGKPRSAPRPSKKANVKCMQKASVADFGRKSGRIQLEQDDDEEEQMPGSGFFPGGGGRSFFFSQGFGGGAGGSDDANVECNQM